MNLKKSLTILSVFTLTFGPAFAGEIENTVNSLKKQKEEAVAKYTAELDKKYVEELKKLQKKAMDNKDLDGAILVKSELEKSDKTPVSTKTEVKVPFKLIGVKFVAKENVGWSRKLTDKNTLYVNKSTAPQECKIKGKEVFVNGKLEFTVYPDKNMIVDHNGTKMYPTNEKEDTKVETKKEDFVEEKSEDGDNTLFGKRIGSDNK